ncbi:MAG: recombinase family protein [Peptococcaceae bacterium]|nr:recombinase family protein [Peptococcaceae bacterium]
MGNIFSYARISTAEERALQTFARQDSALERYAKENEIEYTMQFKEDVSGKSFDERKQWKALESVLKEGDTVVFKDISRFTREAENGYSKYMELMEKGVELIFIDNLAVSTPYIKRLANVAQEQNLVVKTALESVIKLLIIVELDRVEQERNTLIKRIKDGIEASEKKSGRPEGKLDKMTDELEADIKLFLNDRTIKQIDLMNKHNISRNTLKKYVEIVKQKTK